MRSGRGEEVRTRYVIAYDVAKPARLRKTYKLMCAHGDPLQYSVFQCDLSASERIVLIERLVEILNLKEDRILIVDVGPAEGRGQANIEVIGKRLSWEPVDRSARIV